ncbi:MHO_4530 family protein [Mycoplasma sp. OR1901]|uniref:MHO_4530 family protein n=1 Tax=Mycoplasma sp. OR1901 TaxID=2742195 RepID=UPI001582BF92|nr:hypothetical protein [Mycoplasma sp. OR1901]QKT05324.1 hypothetical protein HTZ87_01240 [Mycoplasma sp. OR1901]
MGHLAILTYITVVILIITICYYLAFKFFYFYKRDSFGVIIFKIDNINKRVIRNNKKYSFLSTYLDSSVFNFNKYNYISINDFLNFFDQDSTNQIKDIINKNQQNQENKIEVSWNSSFNIKLSIFERMINKTNKNLLINKPMQMVLKTIDGNNYYCFLNWGVDYNSKANRLYNKSFDNAISENVLSNKKNIIIGFLLKNHHFINGVNEVNINYITDLLELKKEQVQFFKKDDYIYLLLKYRSKKQYNFYLNKVKEINTSSTISRMYKRATILQCNKINGKNQNDDISNLVKYSLYNIDYDIENADKYYYEYSESLLDKINKFNDEYYKYIQIITNNNNIRQWINIKNIVNYSSKNKTQFKIIEPYYVKLNNSLKFFNLFDKNEYLNLMKETTWFNYFTNNSKNLKSTQLILKMSQCAYLSINKNNFQSKNIIPLIYDLETIYDIKLLEEKILSNYNDGILTFFYLENVNRNISFILEKLKIKAVVVSSKISSNLYNSNVLLDCLTISQQLNKNKKVIIYESPPENLEEDLINKIKINYNY